VTNVRNRTSPLWRGAITNPARRCLVSVTDFGEGEIGFDFLTCGYDGDPTAHLVAKVHHPKACPIILHKVSDVNPAPSLKHVSRVTRAGPTRCL
jgi:hypothetical protein